MRRAPGTQVVRGRLVSGTLLGHRLVERLDPVADRQAGSSLQMRLAADVGGEDGRGRVRSERGDFVGEQLLRDFGLQNRVGARRPAAQVRVRHRREIESQLREQSFDGIFELHAVLEGAGGVENQCGMWNAEC